jgi:Leucine-rich repeat (LRR) protein
MGSSPPSKIGSQIGPNPTTLFADYAQLLKTLCLEELDLSGTRVSDQGIECLRKMAGMRKLNLLGARATDASMDVLAGMKRLETVNLYRTQITNSGAARLQELKELTDVDLRYTRVSSNGIEALRAALPHSKVQFAGGSTVRAKKAGAEGPADHTEKAIAEWVRAIGGQAEFSGARLRAIDLSSSTISDAQLSHLSGLSGLEALNLEITQIGDLGLASIKNLTNLKALGLSQTTVSDVGLAHLGGLTHLESLKLAGTLVEGRKAAAAIRK